MGIHQLLDKAFIHDYQINLLIIIEIYIRAVIIGKTPVDSENIKLL